jgi:hypothetical protein
MVQDKRSLLVGGLGAILLCATFAAQAQDSNTVIGPPQLKDFSLRPRTGLPDQAEPPMVRRNVPVQIPPATTTQTPTRTAAPPRTAGAPATAQPRPERVVQTPSAPVRSPVQDAPASTGSAPTASVPIDQAFVAPEPAPTEPLAPPPAAPALVPADSAAPGFPNWLYALPVAALVLFGFVLFRRRRLAFAGGPVADPLPIAAPAPMPAPRPDPVPRPWLELAFKADRASFTDTEAEVQFELEISNTGGSDARNLRIDVKMFNGGAEQDKEIGAFFRIAGRETTKLNLPAVEAGVVGVVHGSVRMAREEMRAMRLDERLLFIPVVAVNALYDWGEGRMGQTSKSYVVGRELEEPSDKMGAFRVDQGPRIWRTVGQRPHNLARRV